MDLVFITHFVQFMYLDREVHEENQCQGNTLSG